MTDTVTRRDALQTLAALGISAAAADCNKEAASQPLNPPPARKEPPMPAPDPVISAHKLGFPWQTFDPFLFCVHHDDAYPAGNAELGPAASLAGRDIGQDFAGKDGWRMYHGRQVPGFPQHPHRGFETVTVTRAGLIDHADSMGAAARYGLGDVQWLTAGKGIQHAEMFPLLRQDAGNPTEFFQIWLNLPKADKMATPYFKMLWADTIPQQQFRDAQGKTIDVRVVAGELNGKRPPSPPPDSYAAKADSDVAIWTIRLQAGAAWTLPPSLATSNRTLYYYQGQGLQIAGKPAPLDHAIRLRADVPALLQAGGQDVQLLVLQGKPIGEPVVQYGPFVMNTRQEIQQAYSDYQRTQFGGWPWPRFDPVHGNLPERFARRPDGQVEKPA